MSASELIQNLCEILINQNKQIARQLNKCRKIDPQKSSLYFADAAYEIRSVLKKLQKSAPKPHDSLPVKPVSFYS